jgi:hypothetical protein
VHDRPGIGPEPQANQPGGQASGMRPALGVEGTRHAVRRGAVLIRPQSVLSSRLLFCRATSAAGSRCLPWDGQWRRVVATMAGTTSGWARTRWTCPVAMAAPGMPKWAEVASSWAKTVPPQWVMARIPTWASVPSPVSTTASARGAAGDGEGSQQEASGGACRGKRAGVQEADAGFGGDEQVRGPGRDEDGAGGECVVVVGLADVQGGACAQDFGEVAVAVGFHVLRDDDRGRQIGRQPTQDLAESVEAAGGGDQGDHREVERVGRGCGHRDSLHRLAPGRFPPSISEQAEAS